MMKLSMPCIVCCLLMWQCAESKRRGRLLSLLSFQDSATTETSENTTGSTTSSSSAQIVAPSLYENYFSSPMSISNLHKLSQNGIISSKSSPDSAESMTISRSSPVAAAAVAASMLSSNIAPSSSMPSHFNVPFPMHLLPLLVEPAIPFSMPPMQPPPLSLTPHASISHQDLMSLGSLAHMIQALVPPVEPQLLHFPVYKQELRPMSSSAALMDSSLQPLESESSLSFAQLAPSPPPSWWSSLAVPMDRRNSGRKSTNNRITSSGSNRNKRMHSSLKPSELKSSSIVSMSHLQMLPNGYSKLIIRRTISPTSTSPSNRFLHRSSEISDNI